MDVYVGMENEVHEEIKSQIKWDEFLRNEEEALNLKKPINFNQINGLNCTISYEKFARDLLEEIPF